METGDTEANVNEPAPPAEPQVARTYEDRLVDAYREAYNNNDPDNLDAVHAEIEDLERRKLERDQANKGPLTRSERLTALKNAAEQSSDSEERANLQSEVAEMEAQNQARIPRPGPMTREEQLADLRNRASETTDSEELVNLQGQIQDLESQPADDANSKSNSGAIQWIAARGSFYIVNLLEDADGTTNATRCYGLYQMEVEQAADEVPRNIRGFDNLTMTGIRGNQPILLTAVTLGQRDIVGQAACLENQKVFYTFGQNFGNIQITGEILLGALADAKAQDEGIQTLREFFANYRVSVFKKPVAVTISRNEAVFAYLVGLDIGNLDSEFNILPFTFHGVLLDLAKTPVGSVNPQGSVTVDGVQVLTEKLLDEPQELKRLLALRDLPEVEAAAVEKKKKKAAKADEPAVGDVVQVTPADERAQRAAELRALEFRQRKEGYDDPALNDRIKQLEREQAEDNLPTSGWARIDAKQKAEIPLNEPEQALVKHRKNLTALRRGEANKVDPHGKVHTSVESYMSENGDEIKDLNRRARIYSQEASPTGNAAVDNFKTNWRGENSVYKRRDRQAAIEAENSVPPPPTGG